MELSPLLLLASIGVLGIGCQVLAWRMGIPAIVFLLLAGIVAGPVSGILRPDELFGELLFPMVSIGVAIILFEGSLTLRFHELKTLETVVVRLVSVGALITWATIAIASYILLDLQIGLALLFGALMTVTGPTVIKPLLHSANLSRKTAKVLQWEGIILDPIGALFTVLVFDYLVAGSGGENPWLVLAGLLATGTLAGLAGAIVVRLALQQHLLPHYLHHVFTLVLVVAVFAGADAIVHEAGLLAVTVMGIRLANYEGLDVEDLLFFKESLSLLLISVLFIVLAARLDLNLLLELGWPALALFGVVLFIARPLSIMASTIDSTLAPGEKAVLAWVAPRGIVAAAIAALLALRLGEAGYEDAEILVPLTFLMIIGTVSLQSLTIRPFARYMGAVAPEPRGFLIVGANALARAIAESLKSAGFTVKLTDTGYENVRAARMQGLDTYFGGAVSEHAERNLDLAGIGRLLALSPNPTINALACVSYKYEFGPENLYRIASARDRKVSMRRTLPVSVSGRTLFGKDVTHTKLASLLSKGAAIRMTRLSEDFGFERYMETYRDKAIPLYALSPEGRLHLFTESGGPTLKQGWQLGALIPSEILEEIRQREAEQKTAADTTANDGDPAPTN